MKNFIKTKSGVTLVEVIVASVILAMVVGGFLSIFLMSSTSVKTTDYAYIATNLAKNRLERLKELDYNSLAQAGETNTRLNKHGIPDLNGDFYRTTEINTSYGTDLTQVTVSVNFMLQGIKKPQPIVLKTVFVNPE